ncbi:tRNA (adenosine(37)-N6)-threonylcarbamoyltransferase complex transferase subunit TsaD [Candidatus Saganbacteria bacterium]|nr:tRNA (adenosine(37)-N6)-threonylcarbamoyltransferase complex transferase subunit TsaD [Candidatus Saganbacteria bacterium]
MKLLAIETSCDETAAAVLEDGKKVLSSVVASQNEFHKKYGGIVPEVASRKHIEAINPVIAEALEKAGKKFKDLDAVAVTYGPGLVGSLLVGLCAAKALAWSLKKPLIGVNHLEGHIYSNFLYPLSSLPLNKGEMSRANLSRVPSREPRDRGGISFPFICLIVSGGHTLLVLMKDHGKYETLGRTRDDAVGEAYDKVARFLNLGYPGGPIIDELAKKGDPHAITFKKPMIEESFGYDFSFSGIKTAVTRLSGVKIEDLAASFQQTVVETLIDKLIRAAFDKGIGRVALAGGVSANSALRQQLKERGEKDGLEVMLPPLEYSTDNAAMIACAAYYKFKKKQFAALDLKPIASLKI